LGFCGQDDIEDIGGDWVDSVDTFVMGVDDEFGAIEESLCDGVLMFVVECPDAVVLIVIDLAFDAGIGRPRPGTSPSIWLRI